MSFAGLPFSGVLFDSFELLEHADDANKFVYGVS